MGSVDGVDGDEERDRFKVVGLCLLAQRVGKYLVGEIRSQK